MIPRLLLLLLCLPLAANANANPDAGLETYGVGDTVEAFALEDQHGATHRVDGRVRVILFSRDMDGGDLIKQALAERHAEFLNEISGVYVADISGMPRLIARMFALPSMRKRPYPMLLDREGELTAALPDVEGQATLIGLRDLRIVRIEHFASDEALAEAVAGLSEGS